MNKRCRCTEGHNHLHESDREPDWLKSKTYFEKHQNLKQDLGYRKNWMHWHAYF